MESEFCRGCGKPFLKMEKCCAVHEAVTYFPANTPKAIAAPDAPIVTTPPVKDLKTLFREAGGEFGAVFGGTRSASLAGALLGHLVGVMVEPKMKSGEKLMTYGNVAGVMPGTVEHKKSKKRKRRKRGS